MDISLSVTIEVLSSMLRLRPSHRAKEIASPPISADETKQRSPWTFNRFLLLLCALTCVFILFYLKSDLQASSLTDPHRQRRAAASPPPNNYYSTLQGPVPKFYIAKASHPSEYNCCNLQLPFENYKEQCECVRDYKHSVSHYFLEGIDSHPQRTNNLEEATLIILPFEMDEVFPCGIPEDIEDKVNECLVDQTTNIASTAHWFAGNPTKRPILFENDWHGYPKDPKLVKKCKKNTHFLAAFQLLASSHMLFPLFSLSYTERQETIGNYSRI